MTSTPPSDGGGVPSPRKRGDAAAAGAGTGSPAAGADESPGVPGFRSWRGVYLFVLGCFIVTVVALTIFSRSFE